MSEWKHKVQVPRMHRTLAMWFQGSTGMICGDLRSLDQWLDEDPVLSNAQKEAFVLRTTDLVKWEKVYSGRGEIFDISCPGKKFLYALGKKYTITGQEQLFLLKSKTFGKEWCEAEVQPPEGSIGINFYREKFGYAWSEQNVWRTQDDGGIWVDMNIEIKAGPRTCRPFVDHTGTFWGLNKYVLVVLDENGKCTEEALPKNFGAIGLFGYQDSIWVVGRAPETKAIQIAERSSQLGTFRILSELPRLEPDLFYFDGDKAMVVGTDVSKMPTDVVVLESSDAMHTWKVASRTSGLNIGVTYIECGQAFWAHCGADRIFRYATS